MIDVQSLSRTARVAVTEIETWVRLSWLHPAGESGRWLFTEVDVARVRMIAELRTLRIDEEAMPVVLSLLDQLYATRRDLRAVLDALDRAASPEVRTAVVGRLTG